MTQKRNKPNKAEILKFAKQISEKEGDGVIFHLGSKNQNLKIPRWSTQIEDFDHVLGGGMPEGRIIEVYGPESSGKTSLGYHLAGLHDMALYIPTEGTFDAENAKVFGNRPGQLFVYRAKYGEQAMNKMIKFAQMGMPLIILDSVPATIPKDDIDKTMKNVNKGNDAQKEERRMGGTARLFNEYLPLLQEVIEQTGTTVILINQVRDKIGGFAFGPTTTTPGGRAIKFYSSVRCEINRKSWIEVPNKDPRIASEKAKIGLVIKGRTVKSKVSNPYQDFEMPMIFGRGFVSFEDLDSVRKEIMSENNKKFAKRRKGKTGDDEE